MPRADLAAAAGVNSFVRQVGGSIGLSVFATLFTQYSRQASTGLASAVTRLRPEVGAQLMAVKTQLLARGLDMNLADALARKALAGRVMLQGTVIGFDKTFILQAIAFVIVLPIVVFLRVPRTETKAHVELSVE